MDEILLNFLRTEKLKPFELGMPIWKVKDIFPKVFEENLCNKTNTTRTFCFDSLVLYFYKKNLMTIEIDLTGNSVKLPKPIDKNNSDITCPKKLNDFERFLQDSNVKFEEFLIETYENKNGTESLLNEDEGIVELKIGESIYAKFIDKELLSIRKTSL